MFFEDQDDGDQVDCDLLTEKAGILNDDDTDVDPASYDYEIWKNAPEKDTELPSTVHSMPNVLCSTSAVKNVIVNETSCLAEGESETTETSLKEVIVNETSRLVGGESDTVSADMSARQYLKNFDPYEPIENISGNLPHWRQKGVTYFVTFRLADSLPQSHLDRWRAERAAWLAKHPLPHDEKTYKAYRRRFPDRLQGWLDSGRGASTLAIPEIKTMIERALKKFDGDRYNLVESIVMPNHVHIVVTPLGEHTLSEILHSWKSFTSHRINKILNKDGENWQKESYDHIIRSPGELERICKYVRDNPRKRKSVKVAAKRDTGCGR